MTKTAIHFFLIILCGSIGASLIGGGFAAIIGSLAPDFVSDLFGGYKEELPYPIRYATAVGMIWGVFIGAAVAGFSCALSVALRLIKLRINFKNSNSSNSSNGEQGSAHQSTTRSESKSE
ncbi:MAG: hypothetical protein AAF546_14560 [Verrucomicrobiota bacterium]